MNASTFTQGFKQIEDVIDARKRLGQYNVYKQTNPLNIECVYSSFKPQFVSHRIVKFDETTLVASSIDREPFQTSSAVRHTDSDITIVRVRCTRPVSKRNTWNTMNDIAIPGDGSHLGESPSMVNLVTLVSKNLPCEGDDEYLVPLSSWDPFTKNEELRSQSDSKVNEKYTVRASSTDPNLNEKLDTMGNCIEFDFDEIASRRISWAGKITKFWKKHVKKTNSVSDPETANEEPNNDIDESN